MCQYILSARKCPCYNARPSSIPEASPDPAVLDLVQAQLSEEAATLAGRRMRALFPLCSVALVASCKDSLEGGAFSEEGGANDDVRVYSVLIRQVGFGAMAVFGTAIRRFDLAGLTFLCGVFIWMAGFASEESSDTRCPGAAD